MFLRLGTLVTYYMQAQDQVQQDNPTLPIDGIRYSMSPFELLTLGPGPPLNSSIYAQNQSSILPDHTFENRFRCEEKLWLPLVQTIEDEVTGYRSSRKRLRKEIEKLGRNI